MGGAAGEFDDFLPAYEPFLSLQGVPIGALYVGMLESQYSADKIDMAVLCPRTGRYRDDVDDPAASACECIALPRDLTDQ